MKPHNTAQLPCGFTLIELVIYLSLTGIAILVFTSFAIDVTKHAAMAKVHQEVDYNGRLLLDRMVSDIRNAKSISSFSANAIHLETYGGPTKRYVWNNTTKDLEYDDGSGILSILNSNQVRVTSLVFSRHPSYLDVISVKLQVEQVNAAPQVGQDASVVLSSTAVRRTSIY